MKKHYLIFTFLLASCDLLDRGSTRVSPGVESTTLTLSASTIALSVTGLTEFGVSGTPSSGVARKITITNSGATTANSVAVDFPTWPSGTSVTTTCGSTLSAAGSCTITITPGATASSDGSSPCSDGTTPTAGVVSVSADNSNTVTANVYVLSYGCIYQGGYVYALDDSPSDTASVKGKVATVTDQAAPYPQGILWSADSSGNSASDLLYGISETSTSSVPHPSTGQESGQLACDGATDGACNTNNIYLYYQNYAVHAPIATSFYAAGLCKQTIASYNDWYLPAICEMGFDNNSAGSGCGSSGTPTVQNMQTSLVDYNNLNLLSGEYFSSTEGSSSPGALAYGQNFDGGGTSLNGTTYKDNNLGVRCSRTF